MSSYIRARLLIAIPVLWGVSTLVFSMMHLVPGDPVELMLSESGASTQNIARLRHQLGLDDPLYVQYGRFLFNALRGDLGFSIFNSRPVLDMILEQLPSTVQLSVAAMSIAIIVGFVLGILAAVRANTWVDYVSMVLALVGVSMPSFWLGLLMIFLFSLRLGWLPVTGQGGVQRLIMPASVLGFGVAATIARLVRSSMLEVLYQDYVVTARAKGLTEWAVIYGHALRNALIPVMTMIGLQFGRLLGGAVIVETVFARQGIGRLALEAVMWKDFPLVQGTVLFIAAIYVLVNLLVDICYAIVDPRIHYE
jgi:ABC-type dipeptide/oligopeptide/nickel transport system permease component